VKLTTEKIRGIEYEIEVDGHGNFFSVVDGQRLTATTFEILKKKMVEHTRARQANVKIPFIYWDDGWGEDKGKIVKGTCIGIHAGNNNLIVRIGSETKQMGGYRGETMFAPEHEAELTRLQLQMKKAERELYNFKETKSLDLKAMVIKQIGEQK
jgi:hypothetical protein